MLNSDAFACYPPYSDLAVLTPILKSAFWETSIFLEPYLVFD